MTMSLSSFDDVYSSTDEVAYIIIVMQIKLMLLLLLSFGVRSSRF